MTARYFVHASTGEYLGAFVDFPEDWEGPENGLEVDEPPVQPPRYEDLYPSYFKLGMLKLEITPDQIDAYIEKLPEPGRTNAKIWWTSAQRFVRNNPYIDAIAGQFGKTPEDVNRVWLEAQEDQANG